MTDVIVFHSVYGCRPAERALAERLPLLHGVGPLPEAPRPAIPLQLHLAEPGPHEDEGFVQEWLATATGRGVAVEAFRYPAAGRHFLDAALPDHDAAAAALGRVVALLARPDGA